MRIDPATNAIDLTQGGHPGPYNYSDMTGYISRNITTRNGTWSVVHDSGVASMTWGQLAWNAYEPDAGEVTVRARTSEDELDWSAWVAIENGSLTGTLPAGRFIAIDASLRREGTGDSPILYDLNVRSLSCSSENTPPRLTLVDQAMDEGGIANYAISAIDGDVLSYTVTGLRPEFLPDQPGYQACYSYK